MGVGAIGKTRLGQLVTNLLVMQLQWPNLNQLLFTILMLSLMFTAVHLSVYNLASMQS